MLLTALVSLAAAGDQASGFAANPEIVFVVECAPLSGMISAETASQMGELAALMDTNEMAWMRLLDPAEARAAGLDLDGGLLVVAGDVGDSKGMIGSIAFSGTADQADALLRSATDAVERDGDLWTVGARGTPVRAQFRDGQLTFSADGGDFAPAASRGPAVLSGLPDADGCVIFARSKGEGKIPEGQLGLHSAFGGGDASTLTVLAELPEHPAPGLLSRPKAPLGGSSVEAPLAVLTVGVPLLDLAELLPDRPATASAKAQIATMKFKIKAGTTIAFTGSKDDPHLAAAMRVGGRMGAPHRGVQVSRALERTLTDNGATVERLDKRTLRVDLGAGPVAGQSLLIGARFGRLYVAMDEAALNNLITGRGAPWLSPEQARFAGDWAIALTFSAPEIAEGQLGFGGDGDLWAAQISAKASESASPGSMLAATPLAAALTGVGARLDETFAQVAEAVELAPPSEPDGYVAGLCMAEMAFDAAFDQFVPLAPYPRTMDELGAAPVDWAPQPEDWKMLGWQPDAEQVYGSYWVEVDPGQVSFVIHGVTDIDGDGVQAHARIDSAQGCQVEQLGPPGAR